MYNQDLDRMINGSGQKKNIGDEEEDREGEPIAGSGREESKDATKSGDGSTKTKDEEMPSLNLA